MSAVALPTTVADIIAEYAAKDADIDQAIAVFEKAYDALGMSATVQGVFVDSVGGSRPCLNASNLRANLLKSGWRAVYNRLQIDSIASAKDKKLFDQALASPPPLTMENTKATFGDYLVRPRFHILKGLAEVFTQLDPAYKSHAKVRIGVKGLPKRVIINLGNYCSGYGFDRFKDLVNALAAVRGQPPLEWPEVQAMEADHKAREDAVFSARELKHSRFGEADHAFLSPNRGITVRKFANGNAHIFFDREALIDINRGLGEFYGEVLPDAEPENVKPSASTAVSKDLQFYWTPGEVVDAALEFANIPNPAHYSSGRHEMPVLRVLEPSCGDGRILDGIRMRRQSGFGIEYHPGRAAEARAKGHAVLTANFLEHPATPEFDAVVMNPPFYGKHYAQHVRHAYKFLRPGGTLVSILPAAARYDHNELQGEWRDLPVASFAEAGTNVPTTMLKLRKAA
jgi:hypothetical protein